MLALSTNEHLPSFVLVPLRQMRGKGECNRFFATRLFDLPLIYLVTYNLSLGSSEKLNLFYKYKKRITLHHRHICVTCKLRKQSLNGVSYTENCFYLTLGKSLVNHPLRRAISNFKGASLLKYLSLMDTFLRIYNKFRQNFF